MAPAVLPAAGLLRPPHLERQCSSKVLRGQVVPAWGVQLPGLHYPTGQQANKLVICWQSTAGLSSDVTAEAGYQDLPALMHDTFPHWTSRPWDLSTSAAQSAVACRYTPNPHVPTVN